MFGWIVDFVIIIELNKLGDVLKKPVGKMTAMEMWSAFLGHAADLEKRKLINEVLERKEAIGMAATVLAAISKDEHERAKFLSRRKFETDMTSNLLTVEERGRRAGLEEGKRAGLEEGRLNGQRETARSMKSEGMSVETIARYTKLSVSEVEEL